MVRYLPRFPEASAVAAAALLPLPLWPRSWNTFECTMLLLGLRMPCCSLAVLHNFVHTGAAVAAVAAVAAAAASVAFFRYGAEGHGE